MSRGRSGTRLEVSAVLMVSSLVILTGGVSAVDLAAAEGPIPGFSLEEASLHRQWEEALLKTPQPDSARRHLRFLTEEPHVAGTPAGHTTAIYIRDRMRAYGLDADLDEYRVLLNYPVHVSIELLEPFAQALSLREDVIEGDKDSADSSYFDGFHGYSADGVVTEQVIYVNYGRPQDYKKLEELGVQVAGKIVIARYGKLFRGLKVRLAQNRGASGVILYSDPAEDGYMKGDIYPDGPWRHPSAIQRGSVQFLSIAPGDPTTPGWGIHRTRQASGSIRGSELAEDSQSPHRLSRGGEDSRKSSRPRSSRWFSGRTPICLSPRAGPGKSSHRSGKRL